MGDRTTVWVTCAEKDTKAVRGVFGWSMKDLLETSKDNGTIITQFEEVNWGGDDQFRQVAEQGIPFTAYAGSGDNYGEALTASYAGDIIEVAALEEKPACVILDNGKPDPKAMANIRAYLRLRTRAMEAMATRKRKRK